MSKTSPIQVPHLPVNDMLKKYRNWFLHNPDMDMVVFFGPDSLTNGRWEKTRVRITWCQPLPEGRTPDPDRQWADWDTPDGDGTCSIEAGRKFWDDIKSNGYHPISQSELTFG